MQQCIWTEPSFMFRIRRGPGPCQGLKSLILSDRSTSLAMLKQQHFEGSWGWPLQVYRFVGPRSFVKRTKVAFVGASDFALLAPLYPFVVRPLEAGFHSHEKRSYLHSRT